MTGVGGGGGTHEGHPYDVRGAAGAGGRGISTGVTAVRAAPRATTFAELLL